MINKVCRHSEIHSGTAFTTIVFSFLAMLCYVVICMPVGSTYFSYVTSHVSKLKTTLRLSCCPQTGFMAGKSKSQRSLNTQKQLRKNEKSELCRSLFFKACRTFFTKFDASSKTKISKDPVLYVGKSGFVTQTSNTQRGRQEQKPRRPANMKTDSGTRLKMIQQKYAY